MKKIVRSICVFAIMLSSGTSCEVWFQAGKILFANKTADTLYATASYESGKTVDFDIPTEHPDQENSIGVPFDIFGGEQAVQITYSGMYRSEEAISIIVKAQEQISVIIQPDLGCLGIENRDQEEATAINIWIVPAVPTSYALIDDIETDAVFKVVNLGPYELLQLSCALGAYFIIYETNSGYWYDPDVINVEINQSIHIDLVYFLPRVF